MIGATLARLLLKDGVEVTALIRPGSPKRGQLPEHERLHIAECSLDELGTLSLEDGRPYDAWFHLGWMGTYGDSRNDVYLQNRNITHTLDAVTTALICIGAGLSPMFRMDVALFVLSGYLCLSLYTYICVILKEEFKLTYGKFGPTEFRLLLILLCILYMYTPWGEWHCEIGDIELGVYDIAGAVISAILFLIYLVQFVGDLRYFGQRDPLKGAKK